MQAEPDIGAALGGEVVQLTAADDVVARAAEHGRAGAVLLALDVLEQLDHPLPAVEALVGASRAGATVVLRVPNSPVTGRRGVTTWSAAALDELKGLLPEDAVLLHQVALRGSALVPAGDGGSFSLTAEVAPGTEPEAFVAAFGPDAATLAGGLAALAAADARSDREERLRAQADVAFLEARVRELERRLGPTAQLTA